MPKQQVLSDTLLNLIMTDKGLVLSSVDAVIYGPTKENGQWRFKTNHKLMTKYKAPDIVNIIKIRRLEWLGHVVRMNETDQVCKEDL
jgi:hypothetical protein